MLSNTAALRPPALSPLRVSVHIGGGSDEDAMTSARCPEEPQ